jgi:hypothetical protein
MPTRAVNSFFVTAFILGVLYKVPRQIVRLQSSYQSLEDWGITEWMVNYGGGFVRRGLPGQILYFVHGLTRVPPNLLFIVVSTVFFLVLCLYLLRKSSSIMPLWALLSAPLLGFPIYLTQTLVRKDVMLLLLLAITLNAIKRGHNALSHLFVASVYLTVGILSHEMFAFLAVPACLLFYFGASSHVQKKT